MLAQSWPEEDGSPRVGDSGHAVCSQETTPTTLHHNFTRGCPAPPSSPSAPPGTCGTCRTQEPVTTAGPGGTDSGLSGRPAPLQTQGLCVSSRPHLKPKQPILLVFLSSVHFLGTDVFILLQNASLGSAAYHLFLLLPQSSGAAPQDVPNALERPPYQRGPRQLSRLGELPPQEVLVPRLRAPPTQR